MLRKSLKQLNPQLWGFFVLSPNMGIELTVIYSYNFRNLDWEFEIVNNSSKFLRSQATAE